LARKRVAVAAYYFVPGVVAYLNNGRLAKYDIKMELVEKTGGRFALYKLSKTVNKNAK
jgi:hypothetical protein